MKKIDMESITILIADDHEIIHNGIYDILKDEARFEIVGHAYNGAQAIALSSELKPQIIFMDIKMPEINGIEATREIVKKLSLTKIIALTQHEEHEYIIQMLNAGAYGFLVKNSSRKEFVEAIETVLVDKRYLSRGLSDKMINSYLEKEAISVEEKPIHLTKREIEIIKKIAEDKNNKEIADELNISLRTVETHRRNIMIKLNAKSVVSLIRYAVQHNLIDMKK